MNQQEINQIAIEYAAKNVADEDDEWLRLVVTGAHLDGLKVMASKLAESEADVVRLRKELNEINSWFANSFPHKQFKPIK